MASVLQCSHLVCSPSPGTTLYYQPGLLYGGSLEHDCSPSRGIGYYLESLLCLAPFMKHPLKIVLRGVTNDQVDPSVSNKVEVSEKDFFSPKITRLGRSV